MAESMFNVSHTDYPFGVVAKQTVTFGESANMLIELTDANPDAPTNLTITTTNVKDLEALEDTLGAILYHVQEKKAGARHGD